VLAIRSNDGTYQDHNFAANYAWAARAVASGQLAFLVVYLVWRPNWQQTVDTHKAMIGAVPPPWVVSMLDVESWEGQIVGDQSAGINGAHGVLADWYRNSRRVIGYGNVGDLDALWPTKPAGVALVVANYSHLPNYAGMLAHQYANNESCAPFGACDANSANDFDDPVALAAALGVGTAASRHRRNVVYQITPTPIPAGIPPDGLPEGSWPATEHVATSIGPAGGWSGRIIMHLTLGWRGGFIQEAWSGPSGQHYVGRYDPNTKQGGLYVKPFDPQAWELPLGDRFLVVRVATPSYGSITPEPER
jgi:hypothetical protein